MPRDTLTLKKSPTTLLRERGWTVNRLVKESGLSKNAVSRALSDNWNGCTHVTVAEAIAEALGVPPEAIKWPHQLTSHGRPSHTASAQTRHVLDTRKDICPVHQTALPRSGICDDCN